MRKQVCSLHIVVRVTLAVNVLQAVKHLGKKTLSNLCSNYPRGDLDCNVGNGSNGKSVLATFESLVQIGAQLVNHNEPGIYITTVLSFSLQIPSGGVIEIGDLSFCSPKV